MFKHFIGMDWSQSITAISRRTPAGKEVQSFEMPSDIKKIREYLRGLKGPIALAFEETTGAQWLYTNLVGEVEKLIICDPYKNKLMQDGPKTDKIDAGKLSLLLRADLLKPVFHSTDKIVRLRKYVSGYEDLIKMGVRLKNQTSAVHRGINHTKPTQPEKFVIQSNERFIEVYEEERKSYLAEFKKFQKINKPVRDVANIPGIGTIGAVKIVAAVVDIKRFKSPGKFLSYCGLITLEKQSGGRSYGRKRPRFNRRLKNTFDIAAMAVINSSGSCLKDYYEYLISEKRYPTHNARKALARKIATITYATLRDKKGFQSSKFKK